MRLERNTDRLSYLLRAELAKVQKQYSSKCTSTCLKKYSTASIISNSSHRFKVLKLHAWTDYEKIGHWAQTDKSTPTKHPQT